MTKEECIGLLKRYAEYNGMGIPNLAGCREAMRMAAELLEIPSLPSNLDEAAKKEIERFCSDVVNIDSVWANMPLTKKFGLQMFKAGAEWREAQMKIPNSTELLSEWNYAKSILKEKDLRGDEWRLAYHAFLFGFTKGLNTKKSNE